MSLEQEALDYHSRAPHGKLEIIPTKPCLTQHDLALGSFGEAYGLGTHHARIAEQMYSLMQAVRQAVGFAGEVTTTVVTSYQRFDQHSAAALGVQVTGPALPATVTEQAQPFTYSVPPGAAAGG